MFIRIYGNISIPRVVLGADCRNLIVSGSYLGLHSICAVNGR
jgi:hypothetical protein